jgi:carboxyl-terminal processing protease
VNLNPITPENAPTPSVRLKPTNNVSMAVCVVVALLVGIIGFAIGTRYQYIFPGSGNLDFSELNEIYSKLQGNYIGSLDKTKLLQGAARGLVEGAGDPFTNYFTPEEARSFNEGLSGAQSGSVGIQIGQNDQGQLMVIAPVDGTPAKDAGILAGDLIAEINGEDSLALSPDVAVTKIRGEDGTTVKLTMVRDGETIEFSLTRTTITVPSVSWEISADGGATWTKNTDDNFAATLEGPGAKIGYLRIADFGNDTSGLVRQAAQDFKKANVSGVLLDLRNNGGGYIDAAVDVSSVWLKSGATVVKEVGRNNLLLKTRKASGNQILEGVKTVVIVNENTASASEITAAALRDNGAATLVGTKTFGKGVAQTLLDLSSGSVLKVTVEEWNTPKDKNIQHNGLEPDVTVEMTAEQFEAEGDIQRTRAIELLSQ